LVDPWSRSGGCGAQALLVALTQGRDATLLAIGNDLSRQAASAVVGSRRYRRAGTPVRLLGAVLDIWKPRRRTAMKKLLLLALAGVAGYLAFNKQKHQQATQDLWSEATDSVPRSR
jgi:hypothetical protein